MIPFAKSSRARNNTSMVGELRSIGLWRANDEADLREHVLDTLPLRPWMELTITAVQPHPSDPGRS